MQSNGGERTVTDMAKLLSLELHESIMIPFVLQGGVEQPSEKTCITRVLGGFVYEFVSDLERGREYRPVFVPYTPQVVPSLPFP